MAKVNTWDIQQVKKDLSYAFEENSETALLKILKNNYSYSYLRINFRVYFC